MKAILLYSALALGALVLVGIALVVFAPRTITIVSTARVKAPKHVVMDNIRYFNRYPAWSPFVEQDPQQKNRVEGTDGALGVKYHWESVREKGLGFQTLKAFSDTTLAIECDIQEPFQAITDFSYQFTDEAGETVITQTFVAPMPPPMNAIGVMIGLEKKMRATNERGLERLKSYTEKNAVAFETAH
jgi:ligand-binding SRPBCC domain-containing protein